MNKKTKIKTEEKEIEKLISNSRIKGYIIGSFMSAILIFGVTLYVLKDYKENQLKRIELIKTLNKDILKKDNLIKKLEKENKFLKKTLLSKALKSIEIDKPKEVQKSIKFSELDKKGEKVVEKVLNKNENIREIENIVKNSKDPFIDNLPKLNIETVKSMVSPIK